ncbi:hypothetical protein [Sodalis sp.]|uniref:hypothetical protein n=1 Tax=Sodalis sp. (in: enterobacteria) TaxID=1898979 RepID=UPI0038735675
MHRATNGIILRASMSAIIENRLFIPWSFNLQADSRALVFALITSKDDNVYSSVSALRK